MIAIRVGKDNLAGELDDSVKRNVVLGQVSGRDQEGLVTQELRAALLITREVPCHDPLETLGVRLRNGVPELGRAEVNVIDGVQVGVFYVPRDWGKIGCASVESAFRAAELSVAHTLPSTCQSTGKAC